MSYVGLTAYKLASLMIGAAVYVTSVVLQVAAGVRPHVEEAKYVPRGERYDV